MSDNGNVDNFENYEGFSEFSHMGRNFGHPLVNLMMGTMLGNNYMPFSPSGQSYYDSFMQRENTRNLMGLQTDSFSNNAMFKAMGIKPNMATNLLGAYAASPDSLAGKAMGPLLGGNPMAASMQLYAGLAGANTMGNFGRQSRIQPGEAMEIMSSLSDKFYEHQDYEGEGGIKEDANQQMRNFMLTQADNGAAGKRYMEDLGYGDLERGADGKLTAKAKQTIQGLDFFGGSEAVPAETRNKRAEKMSSSLGELEKLTGKGTSTEVNRETGAKLSEADKEIADGLKDRLEKQLKSYKAATKEEIDKAFSSGDTAQIAALVARYDTAGEVDTSRVSTETRAQLAAQMTSDLEEYSKLPSTARGTPEQNEKSKQLQAKIATQLTDSRAASQEEVAKAFSTEDPNDVAVLISRYTTSGEIATPKTSIADDFGRKIRNQINTRQITASDLQQDLSDISKDEDTQSVLKRKHKKAKEDLDNNLPGAQDILTTIEKSQKEAADRISAGEANIKLRLQKDLHMSEEDIQQYVDKDTGKLDRRKIKDFVKKLPDLTRDEQIYTETMEAKEAGGKFRGFNFANSRGFKLEDFTGGFVKAADLRMLGDQQNVPPAVAMAKFAENGAGAMSAARSLVGNKSGAELTAFISDFAGRDKVDLASTEGAGEMEDLLRKTKSTARVAGVGIKTMLEIIKATKDLSASNPQLQYMSAGANTEMALKAVGTAAVVGGQMSAADYRAAGGAPGIATRDVTEKQAYAQSNLGGAKAAWLYNAKAMGGDTYKKVSGILDRVQSGRDLQEFGYRELSEAMGISTSQLTTYGNNKSMRAHALADKDIASKIYGMADQDVVKSFYQGAENFSGKNQKQVEAMFKKHMAAGGTLESFTPVLVRDLSEDGQKLFESQKGTIQRSLLNSLRGTEGQKRFDSMVTAQAKLEKELDKEYAGKNAPIVSQLVNAVASGKDFGSKETADAISGIFATKDKDSVHVQNIMKNAQAAGIGIANMSVVATDDKDMLRRGLDTEVNKITAAKKARMLEAGDTAGAAKLENVTAEDLQSLSAVKGIKEASPAKLKRMLADLREQKAGGGKLDAQNERLLKGLETMEKTGTIDSANAIKQIQNGDLKAFGAATIQSAADYDIEQYKNAKKNLITQGMGNILSENSKLEGAAGAEIRSAMGQKEYQMEGGKVNWSKMLEDYGNRKKGGSSYFDKMSDEEYKKVADSSLGSQLTQTKDLMASVDELTPASAALELPKAIADNTETMKKLTEAINSGGDIGKAFTGLASALQGL